MKVTYIFIAHACQQDMYAYFNYCENFQDLSFFVARLVGINVVPLLGPLISNSEITYQTVLVLLEALAILVWPDILVLLEAATANNWSLQLQHTGMTWYFGEKLFYFWWTFVQPSSFCTTGLSLRRFVLDVAVWNILKGRPKNFYPKHIDRNYSLTESVYVKSIMRDIWILNMHKLIVINRTSITKNILWNNKSTDLCNH